MGRSTTPYRRSQAARLAGPADRHLARAALGDLQPQSAVRHPPRPQRLRGIHDRGRRAISAPRSRSTRSGTSRTSRPSCCRSGAPTARPPRRASTAACTRPATPACRPRAWRTPRSCSAKPRRPATTPSTSTAKARRALLHPVAPLLFMREALCLNAHYRRVGGCGELQMAGYAHHAYTLPAPVPTTSGAACRATTSRSARSRG